MLSIFWAPAKKQEREKSKMNMYFNDEMFYMVLEEKSIYIVAFPDLNWLNKNKKFIKGINDMAVKIQK